MSDAKRVVCVLAVTYAAIMATILMVGTVTNTHPLCVGGGLACNIFERVVHPIAATCTTDTDCECVDCLE